MHAIAEIITATGGLGGLAAALTGAATLLAARRTRAQLEPNHGSSVKDKLNRIEQELNNHGTQLLQITHRIDSVDDHAHDTHREINQRLSALEHGRRR